jgi:hypothetical protein
MYLNERNEGISLKLPIGRVSEFRDMNEFSGICVVSLVISEI